jgi:hypothetical protein
MRSTEEKCRLTRWLSASWISLSILEQAATGECSGSGLSCRHAGHWVRWVEAMRIELESGVALELPIDRADQLLAGLASGTALEFSSEDAAHILDELRARADRELVRGLPDNGPNEPLIQHPTEEAEGAA